MDGALRAAGLSPADVGCVVAHGIGSVESDRREAQAIRAVLGDVPVTAPKSSYGYFGAASGALETALGVLVLRHGLIPPTRNYERPDPECPINVVCGAPRPLDRPVVMILSHSPHGQAAALVLGGDE